MNAFVFGNRKFNDQIMLDNNLNRLCVGITTVWTGDARGADAMAVAWALRNGRTVREFAADWNKNPKTAGIIRTKQLIREIPKEGTIAIAFTGIVMPKPHEIRVAGGVRTFLSPGTRISVGLCLEVGIPVTLIWNDGSTSHCTGSPGRRTRTIGDTTQSERLDAQEDGTDLGEVGHDRSATTGKTVNRFTAARNAPVGVHPGKLEMINGKWMRAMLNRDGTVATWVPDETKNMGASLSSRERYDNRQRAFGDAERRSQDFGQTQKAFEVSGRLSTCRQCGEVHRGEDEICGDCGAQLGFDLAHAKAGA